MNQLRDQNIKQNDSLRGHVKILMADDSVTMHRAVAMGLKGTQYQLLSCENGDEALRLCQIEKPRVVLADSDMPGLSGAELISAIKKNPQLKDIKTVLLLSHFENQSDQALSRVPADARIHKPFEARTLVALLNNLVQSSTQNIKESADPTLLGVPEQEVAQKLTEETFKQVEERTREIEKTLSLEGGIREWTQDTTSEEPEIQQTVSEPVLETEPAANVDLWGLNDESSLAQNESDNFEIIRPDDSAPENSDELYTRQPDSEFNADENIYSVEKIGQTDSADDTPELDANFPRPPLPGSELSLKYESPESLHSWNQDQDFSRFQSEIEEPVLEQAHSIASQHSQLSEMEIRKIVREEIEDVFRSWLKSELQNQLQRVLSEIDQA